MAEYRAEFIKVPTHATNGFQTMPVEPSKRLSEEEIRIELCDAGDANKIAEALYTCFPEAWWAKREPLELRPPQEIREQRMTKRLAAAFLNPDVMFIKAVHNSTGQIMGIAGWTGPGHPVHNIFRRSAVDFYGWQEKMGWSNEELEELWSGVDMEAWDGQISKDDETRGELFGDEKHWYLAPLITWPEWQGKGVGSKLLDWAIRQADEKNPPTPMYLESAPTARAVYMHVGFVPFGDYTLVRRGPAIVRGLEAEEGGEGNSKVDKVEVKVVESVAEESLAS